MSAWFDFCRLLYIKLIPAVKGGKILKLFFCSVFPFILFFFYDINSVKWKNKFLFYFFLLGFLMIFTNTAILIAESLGGTAFKPVFLFPAAAFLFLLIYALFFALPFGDTYSVNQKNVICKTGPYAMCRHPGVICFAGFYLFLYFALPSLRLAYFATVSCICNLLYVIFQDMWSFPLTFDGYGDYRNETPFLIPTAKSIRRGLQTLRNRSFSKHEP